MAHVVHTSVYSKMDIRTMVTDAIRRGVDIDRPVEGSNTLLHLAVQMNLCKSVGKLLSAGADPRKENDEGQTAGSIALDNGNQMILQALSLRDEYTVHLRLFNRAQDVSSSRGSMASMASELCSIVSKMIPISMPVPYEDYMDWTDSQRCRNLQSLMESSRNEEKALRVAIDKLHDQRAQHTVALGVLHNTLREREHGLCIQVWEAIQSERASRRAFERATTNVAAVKELLQNALKHVHYFGIVRVAPFKKVFLKSWHRSFVEITGSALVIGSYHDESPAAGRSFSFSMSYKGKRRASRADSTATTSSVANLHAHAHTGKHGHHKHTTHVHDSDGDTDGSNGAATYATSEMMAAHALGPAGLPPTPTRANTAANTSTAGAYHAHHTSTNSTSRASEDTLLAPLRRQFQKLHDKHGQCRSISIQDIVAVEVCKVDKSLGTSYIQIELRIHYLKDGNHLSLLTSPVPINPANISNTGNGGSGSVYDRERIPSNASTASGNSATNSVRTTSSTSVSNAVSSLLSPFKNNSNSANNTSIKHTPSKLRSISTGNTPTFTPIPLSSAATTPTTSNTASHSKRRHTRVPADKLEVVWLKLPMQSNTIASRALAKGRADDTEGPVLTFELFVAILRRIKDEIKVFAVSNGVETLYRVNPPVGEETNSTTGTSSKNNTSISTFTPTPLTRKLSRIDSFASPSRNTTNSPFNTPNTANNTSFYRKAVSSGDLASLDSPSVSDRPPRPHAVHSSNTAINAITTDANLYDTNADDAASFTGTTNTESNTVPLPSPLDLSMYARTDSVNTVGSGASVGSVGSSTSGSVSPKRNANSATFSSVLSLSASHSGTYPSGSLNSASGLTSIESLLGMTHRAHSSQLQTQNSSGVGSTTSMSTSMSTSISTSISTTASMSSSHAHYRSPRYTRPTDPLYEETTADIQSMLEEEEEDEGEEGGEYSDDHSSKPSFQATDDEDTVRSASDHAPRFLKLSRRYTEGDKALNTTHNVSIHGADGGSMFVTEDPTVHTTHNTPTGHTAHHHPSYTTHMTHSTHTSFTTTHVVTHVEHLRGCSFASTGSNNGTSGTSMFRDVDSGDEGEGDVTTRHTIAGDASGSSKVKSGVMSSPGKGTYSASSSTNAPSTPPKLIPIQHPHTSSSALFKDETLYSSEQLSFSAPPVALRRDSSRSSANGSTKNTNANTTGAAGFDAFKAESPRSPRKAVDTNDIGRMNSTISGNNTSSTSDVNNLIQHPAKLSRMLDRARAKRSKIENRLVHLLESREKLREIIQYLQSLRAIVDCPPPTPTRSLAKTKAPSIDKAMQLLNVFGEHINHVTDGLNASSAAYSSSVNTSEGRGRLYDAEEFVRIMLHNSTSSSGSIVGGGNNSNSGSYAANTHVYSTNHSTNTHSTMHTTLQSYGNEYANYSYANNNNSNLDRESFTSTSSRGATPSVSRRVGYSVASIGTNSLGAHSVQHSTSTSAHSPAHIRRLFTEEYASTAHTTHSMYTAHPYSSAGGNQYGGNSSGSNRESFSFRQSLTQAPSPVFPSEPTPQLLRSPPPGYKPEFVAVMSQLERMWECELECFHAVERLAQCLDQRGRTWQRLKALREQEQSMVVPTQQDLYDIEF